MKTLFFTIFLMVSVFFLCAQQTFIKQLNSTEFKKLITKKDGILLDVRTIYEFESGHIEQAEQLNYYSFSFKQKLLLLPKDKPLYLYCRTGYRSNKAAQILLNNGYKNIYNLENGIDEWIKNKYPVVKNSQTSKN